MRHPVRVKEQGRQEVESDMTGRRCPPLNQVSQLGKSDSKSTNTIATRKKRRLSGERRGMQLYTAGGRLFRFIDLAVINEMLPLSVLCCYHRRL